MNVPPYLLAETLNVAAAQRLIRLICPDCKQSEPFDKSKLPRGFEPAKKVEEQFKPVGCEHCFYTGYKGRTAIYEIIPIDSIFEAYIRENKFDIGETLQEKGIRTLAENAYHVFEQGLTSLEEIYPVLLNK